MLGSLSDKVVGNKEGNRGNKEKKTCQIFRKGEHFLPPDTHWLFRRACFFVTSVLRFALLPYCRQR